MSQSEEVSLHETDTGNDKHSVVNGSDYESGHEKDESFEDAVDTVSVRSLTKRSASAQRVAAENASDDDATGIGNSSANDENDDDDEGTVRSGTQSSKPESQKPQRTSSSLSRRLSTTSNMDNVNLDNVNLDDETPTSPPESKATDDPSPASKTLSLSSITSALPAMPWSPPTVSPSSKSPGPEEAAIAASPSNQSPSTSQPPPPPPTRKLTSPFSWLSRSSTSKEKDSTASPPTNARRNTASSIATILSNPEMMLSKLDEENEQDANGAASARNSLKDRFKLLRMQQEAGITMVPGEGENESEVKAVAASEETTNGETTSPTSVPNPTADLAPGTVAGVNAGPSAIQEAQVDWDLWQSVVYEGPAAVARSSAEELNRAIATGIPSAIRGVIWQVLAQSKNEELETAYKELAARGTDKEKKRRSSSTTASSVTNGNASSQGAEAIASSASSIHSEQSGPNGSTTSPQVDKAGEISVKVQAATAAERKRKEKEEAAAIQKLEKVIRRDLGARTSYSKYAAAAGLQDGLFGVCKAYALYDEEVGYAQGMNFLIMPLLFNMPEQEAFCLLVRLMHNYNLRDLFVQDMPGLHMRLYQFERLLEDFEPALYCHLHRRGISPHLYATQWFLTLFAYRFPLQLVLRIYDLIISEGLSAILRFGIVLMQKNASILMGISDMQQLTTYLKDKLFDVYIDKDPSQGSLLESGFFGSSSSSLDKEVYRADQLVRDATEVKITPETLKLYTTEWEEQAKLEKERETELQELRLANQNYAVQLRRLEERVQACDTEQAALATELVHTKVENQELKDENESLKVQVDELRIVIEKQPTEIEDAWKLERDDLMKRNENVHEENRKLESDLAELEENLVQTKMQYAEINSQHETLNRKWSDLKRQFN